MENTSFGPENMTGGTTQNTTTYFTSFYIFMFVFFATIIVGLIANGIVIFLTGCRMKTTVNSIWFLNLAIADFIFILSSVIGLLLAIANRDNQANLIGQIFFIMLKLNLFGSIFFLIVISLDRCLCTWKVVWAQNNRTLFRARIICVIVWLSSTGSSSIFFDIYEFSWSFMVFYDFTVGFLIPFLIIAFSYTAIGVQIKRLKIRKQLRSYRLIISVILAFFICRFPYHVCSFCKLTEVTNSWSDNNQTIFNVVYVYTIYLVHLNSCLNPFLYVFMCDDYKKKLKQSLLLVLETVFSEDHLNLRITSQTQKDEQDKKTTIELLEM